MLSTFQLHTTWSAHWEKENLGTWTVELFRYRKNAYQPIRIWGHFISANTDTDTDTKKIKDNLIMCIKGELRNRFNLISEERVKFCEQNSENLMKIGWKIRKLWHFEVSQIFTKHFLTSRYEYANERVDDVIASLLAIYFVHKMLKYSIFCAYLW